MTNPEYNEEITRQKEEKANYARLRSLMQKGIDNLDDEELDELEELEELNV